MEDAKKIIITITVLVLLVLGLGGFIVYDKFLKPKKEDSILTTIDNVSVNLSAFYQIGETLDKLDLAFNEPTSPYFGYIYNIKKITSQNMDKGAAIYASIRSDLIENGVLATVPEDRAKGIYTKMFGSGLKYDATKLKENNWYKFSYNANTLSYDYIASPIPKSYAKGYISMDAKTLLEQDKVTVTRKIVFIEYGSDNNTTINIANLYKNEQAESFLGKVVLKNGLISEKEVLSKYASKLQTFIYTFEKDKNDIYNLVRIEKQ